MPLAGVILTSVPSPMNCPSPPQYLSVGVPIFAESHPSTQRQHRRNVPIFNHGPAMGYRGGHASMDRQQQNDHTNVFQTSSFAGNVQGQQQRNSMASSPVHLHGWNAYFVPSPPPRSVQQQSHPIVPQQNRHRGMAMAPPPVPPTSMAAPLPLTTTLTTATTTTTGCPRHTRIRGRDVYQLSPFHEPEYYAMRNDHTVAAPEDFLHPNGVDAGRAARLDRPDRTPEAEQDVKDNYEETMLDTMPVEYSIRAMGRFLPRSKKPDPGFVAQDKQDSVYPPL